MRRGEVLTPPPIFNPIKPNKMKTYFFTMLRTYDTLIQVEAENPEEALKEFEKLGDSVYDLELEQNCVNEETLTMREGWEGVEMPVMIEKPIYKLVKND